MRNARDEAESSLVALRPEEGFSFIMADPPWRFYNYSERGVRKNPVWHYDCMPLQEIMDLPIARLAAKDCMLWLWATNPMLPQALETLKAWGFSFKTAGHWVKRTKTGKLAFATGYILRSAGEPFLIGTIGRPKTTRSVRSVIEGTIREHSRKPEEAYDAAERLMPNVHRLDLFSRETRPGWVGWGREAGKFDLLPDDKSAI